MRWALPSLLKNMQPSMRLLRYARNDALFIFFSTIQLFNDSTLFIYKLSIRLCILSSYHQQVFV
jgi:hypothetical protein